MRKASLVIVSFIAVLIAVSGFALKNGDVVFRGGDCSDESFRNGSTNGNTHSGPLTGISVYGRSGFTYQNVDQLRAANSDFRQRSGCWAKVKDITTLGGTIKFNKVNPGGPDHHVINGLTAAQLVNVFRDNHWED